MRLPIHGGKLKSSKYFSSSNPQLPYICSHINNHQHHQHANSSSPSINSSVVWREVCPNNFNLYASSASPFKSIRAASEERPSTCKVQTSNDNVTKLCSGNMKKLPSNYDNYVSSGNNSPILMTRKSQHKFWSKSPTPSQQMKQKQFNTIAASNRESTPFLYDRRLNKSFETANGLLAENSITYIDNSGKNTFFRRSSTPTDVTSRDSVASSWCCGNFVKQWKKMNQHY